MAWTLLLTNQPFQVASQERILGVPQAGEGDSWEPWPLTSAFLLLPPRKVQFDRGKKGLHPFPSPEQHPVPLHTDAAELPHDPCGQPGVGEDPWGLKWVWITGPFSGGRGSHCQLSPPRRLPLSTRTWAMALSRRSTAAAGGRPWMARHTRRKSS